MSCSTTFYYHKESSTIFKTKEEKAVDVNRDFRRFICERWVVDPKICFIDRFKWNPPVIDEVLRKLQVIFVIHVIRHF